MRLHDAKKPRPMRPTVNLAAQIVAWNAADPATRGPHPTAAQARAHGSLGLATAYRLDGQHRAMGRRVREAVGK